MAARVIVALTLAPAGRIRPECRTEGCTWTGWPWLTRYGAELQRDNHRRTHLPRKAAR